MSVIGRIRALDARLGRRGNRRRVLVDGRSPVNYEMVSPVVRVMASDPRVMFFFTASEEPSALARIYRDAAPGTRLIDPRLAAWYRWDAYLTSDFMWATLPRGTHRIQMFHGVGGKYGFDTPDVSVRQWDHLFFVNERRRRNFIKAGVLPPDSRAAKLIGMPKVDCLVDGSLQRARILRDRDLDPSLPTVLYAPTWSPASSLNVLGVDLIRHLSEMPINLIVKLHDRSRDPRPQFSGGVRWDAVLRPLLSTSRTRLDDGANIAPLLAASDLLITDHSSAGFEYLLLDRPLIRIHLPALIAMANVHPSYVDLLSEAAATAVDAPSTRRQVERALAMPSERSEGRRRVAADLFYRPGSASARCAAALYDILELAPHPALASLPAEEAPCPQIA